MALQRRGGSSLPKASDILADYLRNYILANGLEEGAALPPESQLIEQLEYSRGTVREALRILEVEGTIRIRRGPKGGIEVATPDVTRLTQALAVLLAMRSVPLRALLDFRLLVEPAAAAAAAANATEAQRQALLQCVQDGSSPALRGSVDFHGLVGEATNDGIMSVLLGMLHEVLAIHTSREMLSAEAMDETSRVHQKIADAIGRGDAARAERLMKRHLNEFRAMLEDQGRLDEPIVSQRSSFGGGRSLGNGTSLGPPPSLRASGG